MCLSLKRISDDYFLLKSNNEIDVDVLYSTSRYGINKKSLKLIKKNINYMKKKKNMEINN